MSKPAKEIKPQEGLEPPKSPALPNAPVPPVTAEPLGAGIVAGGVDDDEKCEVPQSEAIVDFSTPDRPDNVVFADDGSIKGGTVAKILQKLTSNDSNVSLLFDFLITYRSYTSPTHVLALLRRRFEQVVDNEDTKIVRIRVMNFMKQWIEKHAYDWVDDADLVTRFTGFIDYWVTVDPSYQRTAASLNTLVKKATEPIEKEKKKAKTFNAPPPPPEFPSELDPAKLNIHQINTPELARQWTLLEWSLWEEIKPWEFLNCNWARKHKESLAPNILALTKNFNKAAGWVATTILNMDSLKERVKIVTKFIQLAEELRLLANFNGVMEILSGLGSAAVHRLKQTWEALPKAITDLLANLKQLMSPDQSFKRYRENLKNVNPPTIPYLGISLTDLTFIYDGSKDSTASGLVNFAKCRMVAQIIKTLMQYQHTSYHFVTVPVIREYLKYPTIWDESSQYTYSLYVEPRPGTEPPTEPPAVVCTSETPPWAGENAVTYNLPQKTKIIKEPPRDWKSSTLVIRRGVLRAADLRHAVTHLLYISDYDPNFNGFSNTFFTSIKTFGGLSKIFEVFEQLLENAPLEEATTATNPASSTNEKAAAPPGAGKIPSEGKKSGPIAALSNNSNSPRSASLGSHELLEGSGKGARKVTKKAPSEPVASIEEPTTSSGETESDPASTSLKPPKATLVRSSSNPPEIIIGESSPESSGRSSPDLSTETARKSPQPPATQPEPYWPQKTKRELTMRILEVCVYWGTRYASPPSRDQKALQLLQTWMEQSLILVEGMKETVQGAVISFVRTIPMLGLEATRRTSVSAAPKVHPIPNVPVNQQVIRMFHPEEIARQLALWYHSEYSCFTRDEVFQLSSYVSSSSSSSSGSASARDGSQSSTSSSGTSAANQSSNSSVGGGAGGSGGSSTLSPSGGLLSPSYPSSSSKTPLSVLTQLSHQQEKWIRAELMSLEGSKKKRLATFECFVEVAQYSLDFNNFAAVRQLYSALSDSAFEALLESSSKKTKDIWSQLKALFASPQNSSATPAWNQRIASQLSLTPTSSSSSSSTSSSTSSNPSTSSSSGNLSTPSSSSSSSSSEASSPMILPIEWVEASISHNQTEKDWWKGRSGMYNFDKLGMVTQTWKAIERTRQPYSFTLCPALKDYIIAAATDANNDVPLNGAGNNPSAPTSARKKNSDGQGEFSAGVASGDGDNDDSEDGNSSSAADESEKRKSSFPFKGMFGLKKPKESSSSSSPSSTAPNAANTTTTSSASNRDTVEASPRISARRGEPSPGANSASIASGNDPMDPKDKSRGQSFTTTPRNSRGGSASSSQDSSSSYANTPDFRAAVVKMLQEDEDFKTFIQSALSAGAGSPSPAPEKKRRRASPSPSISVSSSSPSNANNSNNTAAAAIAAAAVAEAEAAKVARLEAKVKQLQKRLDEASISMLTDSDSSELM